MEDWRVDRSGLDFTRRLNDSRTSIYTARCSDAISRKYRKKLTALANSRGRASTLLAGKAVLLRNVCAVVGSSIAATHGSQHFVLIDEVWRSEMLLFSRNARVHCQLRRTGRTIVFISHDYARCIVSAVGTPVRSWLVVADWPRDR